MICGYFSRPNELNDSKNVQTVNCFNTFFQAKTISTHNAYLPDNVSIGESILHYYRLEIFACRIYFPAKVSSRNLFCVSKVIRSKVRCRRKIADNGRIAIISGNEIDPVRKGPACQGFGTFVRTNILQKWTIVRFLIPSERNVPPLECRFGTFAVPIPETFHTNTRSILYEGVLRVSFRDV